MKKKHQTKADIPFDVLRNCKAIVYTRVGSQFIGEAELQRGAWYGKFVAVVKLPLSGKLGFLVRLNGERYAQTYIYFNCPKIYKTKWYTVSVRDVNTELYFDTKQDAENRCKESERVVKGAEIVELPDNFSIPVIFS
jgi:hypothetical protein